MNSHLHNMNNRTARRQLPSNRSVSNFYDYDDYMSEVSEYEDCCCISSLIPNFNLIQVNHFAVSECV